MTHQIYWWWSDALKQYGHGRLLACAESADDARPLARQAGRDWWLAQREWAYDDSGQRLGYASTFDEYDREEWGAFLAKLDTDLSVDPETCQAIGVPGSE